MATFDINNTARREQYVSTGQAGPFVFNFQVNASSELKVYIDDVEKTEATHYTVSLNADGTGSVTFTTATTSGELITIIGDQPLSRTTVFQVGQANNPTTLETEFDNVIIRQQQIKEITDRALQLKPSTPRTVTGSGTSGPIYFPYDATVANNANRIIKYNAAGTGLETGSTTTNIDSLAAIASDISNVSSISADVTSVAADATDIGIVSTNIASVNTVATNINDVIKVADDLNEAISEVETVANDLNEATSEIEVVANNIANVNTVGNSTNIANIGTVAGEISPTNNISTLAAISANITQAASDSADIQTVASDSADIRTLADIEDGTVATNAVSNAGNNSTNITTVAGQISPTNNISTVAVAATNIGIVAGQISPTNNISTVAGANANISTIASNLTGANTIGTVATDLSGSNTIGTVATNITSVQDVASNISGVNSFAERYRVSSSDPTTSLDAGDLAFNTSGSVLKYYDGSSWQTVTAGGITDIAQDSTPQLGGTLDLNSNDITGTGNLNFTGNITLTGTVDGRDVSTDGTKLDTIATSATANPNAIDNLVEDLTPQLGGNLDTNGNNINFGDNDIAQFGASNDLQIYHDGTQSQIADVGTGSLKIRATNLEINNSADSKQIIQGIDGGAVTLFHNGSIKLATTSSGVNITGTATATTFSGSGASLTSIPNGALDNNSITINGSSVSLGGSTTIETGTSWQSSIKTANFTAVAGEGYWINTSGGAVTVTLPSSASVGDTIELVDYSRDWATNNVTINPNGLNFQGASSVNPIYDVEGQSVRLIYSGATQGWIPTVDDDVTYETPVSYSFNALIVAGGGGAGNGNTGGGGAGGYRTSTQTVATGTTITCTIGNGGASGGSVGPGGNSSISGTGLTTITSAGGGQAGVGSGSGSAGGSGGGAGYASGSGAAGNTPAVTPSQGNAGGGGQGGSPYRGGGGGGASQAGTSGPSGGHGGDGSQSSITGSATYYAGGGGGSVEHSASAGSGGQGGGGNGNNASGPGQNGTANTGGGGGGCYLPNTPGQGGSGVVILSVPTANYSGTTTGSPTISTSGSNTIIKFTGSGSYTA